MQEDVRDKPYLEQRDILRLNFIRDRGPFLYRRHHRAGLRSHIMEVLSSQAVEHETKGVIIAGVKWFPRAEPVKMLRIFRTRFKSLKDAEAETKRVKIIEAYLAPDHLAKSDEFLVDYILEGECKLLLCGLQEYVSGVILDPWQRLSQASLISLSHRLGFRERGFSATRTDVWIRHVLKKAETFIDKVKMLILEAGYVPDLAGVGNLLLTRSGHIKLVDINNISQASFEPKIHLDDRGYPVCDKSIEALSLLEKELLGRPISRGDPIYSTYLDSSRMREVRAVVKRYCRCMEPSMFHPEPSPSRR